MSEIRMEVSSDYEAIEFCKNHGYTFVKCYMGRGDNYGKLMMLAEDNKMDKEEQLRMEEFYLSQPLEETKDFVIKSTVDKDGWSCGPLYVCLSAHNKITFDIRNATLFTKKAAEQKAYFMSKSGKYIWKASRFR